MCYVWWWVAGLLFCLIVLIWLVIIYNLYSWIVGCLCLVCFAITLGVLCFANLLDVGFGWIIAWVFIDLRLYG